MINISKKEVGDKAIVYIVENAPPDFDLCFQRAKIECEGRNHKFIGGKYKGMTLKEAVIKDGKRAVWEIYQYIENAYEPDYANSLKESLKYFVKTDRLTYSLKEVIMLKELFKKEIEEYQNRYMMNIEAELEHLDKETKIRIRNFILY